MSTTLEYPTLRWDQRRYANAIDAGIFDDQRVELIEGEIIEMSPIGSRHSGAPMYADHELRRVFEKDDVVFRCQMSIELDSNTRCEPDLAIVHGQLRDFGNRNSDNAELIVEIAKSSLRYDKHIKSALYARAQIPEYWIVNLIDNVLEVFRTPEKVPTKQTEYIYADRRIYSVSETIAPLAKPDGLIAVRDLIP